MSHIWLALASAIFMVAFAIYALFLERHTTFDEAILSSVVNMIINVGELTYPAHSYPDAMVVHPPVHYLIVAWFTRLGPPVYQAAAIPLVIWALVLVASLWKARFSFGLKLVILFSFYSALIVWGFYGPLRPDLHLVAAWFCGIVLLGSAKVAGWSLSRLFVGTLALTFASTLHYPGWAAFLGAPLIGVWCIRDLGLRHAGARLAAMALAGLFIGIPYLAFFVIPNLEDIKQIIAFAGWKSGMGGLELHLATYKTWVHEVGGRYDHLSPFYHSELRPLATTLSRLPMEFSIPAGLIGAAALLVSRQTRGIALAGAPHLLFLTMVVAGEGKNATNTGYYSAEFLYYFVGIGSLFVLAVSCVCGLWGSRQWIAAPIIATLLFGVAVASDVPLAARGHADVVLHPGHDEVVRYASKTIFGDRALIGSAGPVLWYSSGARYFYFITGDLLYPSDISKVDLKNYFSIFDAVIVGTESYATWNQQRIAPISLLLNWTLGLRAFFLHNEDRFFSYLALSARTSGPVQVGYIYNEQTRVLTKFQADYSGDTVFLLAKVRRSNVCETLTHDPYIGDRLYGCEQLLLPGQAPAKAAEDTMLAALVLPANDDDRARTLLGTGHEMIQWVRGRLTNTSVERLPSLRTEPVSFPRTYAEAEARIADPEGPPSPVKLHIIGSAPNTEVGDPRVTLVAESAQWDMLADAQVAVPSDAAAIRLSFQLDVQTGGAVINVLNAKTGSFLAQVTRPRPRPAESVQVALPLSGIKTLQIQVGAYNWAGPARTRVAISDMRLEPIKWPIRPIGP
jgi:hypothetical protein